MDRLSGHTAVLIGDKMVVYGGKTSALTLSGCALALDVESNQWNRVATDGITPRARAFHSAVAHDSSMIVFGGLLAVGMDDIHFNMFNVSANADALSDEQRRMPSAQRLKPAHSLVPVTQSKLETSSLFALNLRGRATWHEVLATGTIPPTRCYHNATVYDGCMLITGGYSVHTTAQPRDKELTSVYSTYALDLRTMVWREIVSASAVPKRWGVSAVVSSSHWIQYGGIDIVACTESSAISVLNIPRREWKVLAPATNHRYGGDAAQHSATVVRPRAMHTAVRWGDRFYIFGGAFDLGGVPTNQVCQFDLLSGSMSVTHGGERSDTTNKINQSLPAARYSHTAVVLGTEMVVFGGTGSNGKILSDVWSMSLETRAWRHVVTHWSSEAIDNVYGRPNGSMPSNVYRNSYEHSLVSERMAEEKSRHDGRNAGGESLSINSKTVGSMQANSKTTATPQDDIKEARSPSRLVADEGSKRSSPQDLTPPLVTRGTHADSSLSDRGYGVAGSSSKWGHELETLREQNARWQTVSEGDSATVVAEFMAGHDRILVPTARKAILNCETPTVFEKKRTLYQSPSLIKLGLRSPQQ